MSKNNHNLGQSKVFFCVTHHSPKKRYPAHRQVAMSPCLLKPRLVEGQAPEPPGGIEDQEGVAGSVVALLGDAEAVRKAVDAWTKSRERGEFYWGNDGFQWISWEKHCFSPGKLAMIGDFKQDE